MSSSNSAFTKLSSNSAPQDLNQKPYPPTTQNRIIQLPNSAFSIILPPDDNSLQR